MEDAARSVFSASLALLAGYSFVRLSYFRRFRAEHLRPDRYALHVLGLSFVLLLAGSVAAELIPHWTSERFHRLEQNLAQMGITAAVINAILFGISAAAVDNVYIRCLMGGDVAVAAGTSVLRRIQVAALARFIHRSNDSAVRAIYRATVLRKELMVTLQSNKVYVGKPCWVLWDDPTQPLTFIKILPRMSGYRDPSTKQVTMTTRYDILPDRLVRPNESGAMGDPVDPLGSDIWNLGGLNDDEVDAHIDIEDLGIVIAWSQVESLAIHDDNIYNAFQSLPSFPPTYIALPPFTSYAH